MHMYELAQLKREMVFHFFITLVYMVTNMNMLQDIIDTYYCVPLPTMEA
jgi:hypothetical protein